MIKIFARVVVNHILTPKAQMMIVNLKWNNQNIILIKLIAYSYVDLKLLIWTDTYKLENILAKKEFIYHFQN